MVGLLVLVVLCSFSLSRDLRVRKTSGEPIRKVDAICLRDILVVIDGPGIGRRLCAEQCQMGRSLRL